MTMKTYFSFIVSIFIIAAITPQKKKSLYVIDFHNAKEYNSIFGKNLADEFQSTLEICNNRYEVIPRVEYQQELKGLTFEKTKDFLQTKGIEYVIYGDVFHDEKSKKYVVEYIFENHKTGAIILIEKIEFSNTSELVNASNRRKMIEEELNNNKEFCKRRRKHSKKIK